MQCHACDQFGQERQYLHVQVLNLQAL